MSELNRAFVRIDEGLVHYRTIEGDPEGQHLPLYMAHAGPVSSRSLEPLIDVLGHDRTLYAPDTLGFGDSAPPAIVAPDLDYYADSAARVLDALDIGQCDFYGSHTGAHIGCELAIRHPGRVRRLICDGISVFPPALREELLENYAPEMRPDDHGGQFAWAWQFLRDQAVHFPYYRREPSARTGFTMWPSDMLHDMVLDVLKALQHYDKGYKAVFRHDVEARLPLVNVPTLAVAGELDPLAEYVMAAAKLIPGAENAVIPNEDGASGMAARITSFLD